MDSEILLIIVVLLCLMILSVIIKVMVSNRGKEQTDYSTGKMRDISTGNFDERLKNLIEQKRIIEAVKLVRESKNIGLKEAKDYINKFMRGEETEGMIFESSEKELLTPEELDGKVFEMLVKKQKIHAIKLVKENLNIGLKEAKDYVEEIESNLNL